MVLSPPGPPVTEPPAAPGRTNRTTPRRTLPAPLTPFIGREREVQRVRDLLLHPGLRLVTLTGPGGVGKTRLSLQVGAGLGKPFAEIVFVPLADITDPDALLPAVAQALDLHGTPGASELDTLARALEGRAMLLILDNLEQVPAASRVAELLHACAGVTVLATSREILRVSGEVEFTVEPLKLPDAEPGSATDLGGSEAVRLFIARARSVRPDFILDDANAPVVADICRRLDGLPLAIELAAVRLRHLPPRAILARLERRLPLLTGGALDQPARLRAMRDAIAWSYGLLDEREQALFRRLAVFTGGFTLAPAVAVCGGADDQPVLDVISSLVDKSLVRHEAESAEAPRYRMLETIREFGLERLDAGGETEEVRRAHAGWFLSFAEDAAAGVLMAYVQTGWLQMLDRERDNLRAALAWYSATGQASEALRLAGALTFYWYYRGHLAEGRRALERALAADPDERCAPALRAWALTGIGLLASVQGDLAEAIARLSEALALWGPADRSWGPSAARSLLGGVFVGQGRDDEAAELFREGPARFDELGNQAWVAHARFHLGAIAFARGDRETARAELRAAADGYDAIGARLDAIDPIRYLGLFAIAENDLGRAAELFADNLARLEERGSRAAVATGLTDVATLAARHGDARAAAVLFGAAEAILRAERAALSLPARAVYEAAMAATRDSLGERAYPAARAEGAGLPLGESLAVAAGVLASAADRPPHSPVPVGVLGPDTGLTPREREILHLLVAGKTNPEIAEELYIGTGTVRNHVSNILAKLGARTRTEAADLARRQGLL